MIRASVCLLICICATASAQTTQPFVIGMYSVPATDADMDAVKKIGVSHVHVYTLTGTTPKQLQNARDYLDLAQKHGLKVVFDFNGKRLTSSPSGLADLKTIVGNVKSHPALEMWYLFDEPVPKTSVATLRPYYDYLKAQTPQVPVALCLNHAEHWQEYAPVSDIILNDFYPVRGNEFPDSNLRIVTTFTHEALHAGRSVMPVIQCFNWACFAGDAKAYRGFPVEKLRYPNAAELRYMIYANLAQGVDGIFFYSYLRGQRYDPAWFANVFAPVVKELRDATDATAGAQRKTFRVIQDFDIYMCLYTRGDSRWLILANGQAKSRALEESLDGAVDAADLTPLGSARPTNAAIRDGKIRVAEAQPWEVFVWQLTLPKS